MEDVRTASTEKCTQGRCSFPHSLCWGPTALPHEGPFFRFSSKSDQIGFKYLEDGSK